MLENWSNLYRILSWLSAGISGFIPSFFINIWIRVFCLLEGANYSLDVLTAENNTVTSRSFVFLCACAVWNWRELLLVLTESARICAPAYRSQNVWGRIAFVYSLPQYVHPFRGVGGRISLSCACWTKYVDNTPIPSTFSGSFLIASRQHNTWQMTNFKFLCNENGLIHGDTNRVCMKVDDSLVVARSPAWNIPLCFFGAFWLYWTSRGNMSMVSMKQMHGSNLRLFAFDWQERHSSWNPDRLSGGNEVKLVVNESFNFDPSNLTDSQSHNVDEIKPKWSNFLFVLHWFPCYPDYISLRSSCNVSSRVNGYPHSRRSAEITVDVIMPAPKQTAQNIFTSYFARWDIRLVFEARGNVLTCCVLIRFQRSRNWVGVSYAQSIISMEMI